MPNKFFKVGGTLSPDSPSYVVRLADEFLYQTLLADGYCYILTPRQMGKSSLMVRTAARLRSNNILPVLIDLSQIGTGVDIEAWYLGLLTRLKTQIGLDIDLATWWQESSLSPVNRFTTFIRDIILQKVSTKVIVFIDEIDSTLQLNFAEDFFGAVRALYNARATEPKWRQITFVFLGVATPNDLDKSFNIGDAIDLHEFTQVDAGVLKQGLLNHLTLANAETVFDRIFYWTNGHPYLTQKLCAQVIQQHINNWSMPDIDDLIEDLFLSTGKHDDINIQSIQTYILNDPRCDDLLKLYQKIYQGRNISEDNKSPTQNRLRLIGLVRVHHGHLEIRNNIYKHVFNAEWINENIPAEPVYRRIKPLVLLLLLLLVCVSGFLVFNYLDPLLNDSQPKVSIIVPTNTHIPAAETPIKALTTSTTAPVIISIMQSSTPESAKTTIPTEIARYTATVTKATIPTPTMVSTSTATSVLRPRPHQLNFTCEYVEPFSVGDTIPFQWQWNGQLIGDEYLEIRIGPRNSTFLKSQGKIDSSSVDGEGVWLWQVPASMFFEPTAYDYEWQIVHMSANRQIIIAESTRGCITVQPR